MRVANWNPKAGDKEIMGNAMDRLEKAANVVAEKARQKCAVGVSRPGTKDGKDWTAREAGALKKSIRVVRLHGDPKRNVRVYAGNREAFYSRFVEYGTVKMKAKPFLRPALNSSKAEIKNILENG
jgi:HK97 gp10 family phage protein